MTDELGTAEVRHAVAIYDALTSGTRHGWRWVMGPDTAERITTISAGNTDRPSAAREVLTLAAATGQLRMFDIPVRIDEHATTITLERVAAETERLGP